MGLEIFWGCSGMMAERSGEFLCRSVVMEPSLVVPPPMLREAPVSDTLPSDVVEIVGAANEPNGWREGTGRLGLLLRDAQGKLRWHLVESVEIKTGPLCWSQSEPVQILKHYRLVNAASTH